MKEPAQQCSETIEKLQTRIQILMDENRLLKERLDEAGVSYADIVADIVEEMPELYDPNQGARIKKFEVTDKIASNFFMMFCRGRKDVYDLRYTNPRSGKTDIIRNALTGGIETAIYRKKMAFAARIVS